MAHIHILGICGTFMGGIAALAQAAGHRVTGCDMAVYPPMSTQLREIGIELIEGYGVEQIDLEPDLFIIGNVISRGNPLMEEILNRSLPYCSGPQWLAEQILAGRHVLAVAGTHGKTTTTAMLVWILEANGLNPSFLIGGVPVDFGVSSRLTDSKYFVIEADEYDTAFFDKRSKFVHYRPKTALLNNLEFDHADIFDDLEAIEKQFHYMIRTVPSNGRLIVNSEYPALDRVLARGCWSEVHRFGPHGVWRALSDREGVLSVRTADGQTLSAKWPLLGDHNRDNAIAAIAAAAHVGVRPVDALEALSLFTGVKRRLEMRGRVAGVTVYDDFAHHPTAIATTLAGLRRRIGPNARLLVLFEPRSNTMKLGVMRSMLPGAFSDADLIFCYTQGLGWDIASIFEHGSKKAEVFDDLEKLISAVAEAAHSGDHVIVMSNGGFGGVIDRLFDRLSRPTMEKRPEKSKSS